MRIPRLTWPRLKVRDRRLWILAAIAAIVVVAYAASFMLDEPLRRTIERRMNAKLNGYTVRLGGASFHPHGFSLDLLDLSVLQNANPDPPVMNIRRLTASVQWRALARLKLVANMVIDRPLVYVNLAHLRQEATEKVPVKERGWQDALQAAYPLKINELQITDGEVSYVDPAKPFKPLRLTKLYLDADNIRNIKSPDRTYPSALRVRAVVFDTGSLTLEGNADFLAEPYPGVKARVILEQMQMDYFHPVTRRYHVNMTGGVLSAAGNLEFSPAFTSVELENVTVRDATLDYVNTGATAKPEAGSKDADASEATPADAVAKSQGTSSPASRETASRRDEVDQRARDAKTERGGTPANSGSARAAPPPNAHRMTASAKPERAKPGSAKPEPDSERGPREESKAAEAAKVDRPDVTLAVNRVDILHSTLGYVNETPGKPSYRVFFTHSDVRLTGLTNQSAYAPAQAIMRGKFMGSGDTDATLAFRPRQKGGDLNLKVEISSTDMVAMNELLRAFGKFEVEAGEFSLYSEVAVHDGVIGGYVKPLFKNIVVRHDPGAEKSLGQKLKEHLISGAAKLLKNRPRREVATKTELSGRLDKPQTSIWQIIVGLVQNAFLKAILPGFDRSVQSAAAPPATRWVEASPPRALVRDHGSGCASPVMFRSAASFGAHASPCSRPPGTRIDVATGIHRRRSAPGE